MSLDFEKEVADIEAKIEEFKAKNPEPTGSLVKDLNRLELERAETLIETYAHLTPWQTVQVARHPDRPLIRDFIKGLCSEFIELHGDRLFGDDHGMIGGFAMIDDQRIMVIGHQKGRDLDEKIKCNFGQACPEGYRKALRLMKLAEKFHIPVVTFIDTPGAFPGRDADERGQAEAFAFGQSSPLPQKVHEGNHPVSLLLFEQLDPTTLGRLVALYEHKVFTQSVVWGINAFDQWGVELGKKLAEQIAPLLHDMSAAQAPQLRPSLRESLRQVRALQSPA